MPDNLTPREAQLLMRLRMFGSMYVFGGQYHGLMRTLAKKGYVRAVGRWTYEYVGEWMEA